jgi:hypothetical protein
VTCVRFRRVVDGGAAQDPILTVMHNNRGYHQEVMHVRRMANRRDRVAWFGMYRSPIGTSIENSDRPSNGRSRWPSQASRR